MDKKEDIHNYGWYKPPIGKKIWWVNFDTFKPSLWHRIIAKILGLYYIKESYDRALERAKKVNHDIDCASF